MASDGTIFKCSASFVRRYLRNTLCWSERRATKAAQKLPANLEQILTDAFLREAYVIRDHGVPAALRLNTDQTQLVYQQGTGSTWTARGAKQVATVGQEEKRAFTLLVDDIIAPYFEAKQKELGLAPTQQSIWKIDCWSVHKSKEFRGFMTNHPFITVLFVPGGCTGVWHRLMSVSSG
ncbi:hypothetical protein DFH06DRAFT_1267626 [Mycena polygramma]|nr:hypothetical protein DFH06DRAFT_1267626 [Mycena polygramma]